MSTEQKRSLVDSVSGGNMVIKLLHLMSEDGLSEEDLDHFHDMLEHQPQREDNRSMTIYLTEDGKVDLVVNCYGIEVCKSFTPTAVLFLMFEEQVRRKAEPYQHQAE